jgi:hypothetical protein
MAGRRSLVAGVALAGVLGGVPVDGRDDVAVTVHAENYAAVPPGDWDLVTREVEDIYRAAGVTLKWAGPLRVPMREVPRDGVRRVALVVLNIQEPFAGSARDTADVLGRAAPELSRAWVFANRVTEITKAGSIDADLLLARAVAHEIGHLLLGSMDHAPGGIMRAGLPLEVVGFFRFSEEQATRIRDGIRRQARAAVPG